MQCAAVNTYLLLMSAPPQLKYLEPLPKHAQSNNNQVLVYTTTSFIFQQRHPRELIDAGLFAADDFGLGEVTTSLWEQIGGPQRCGHQRTTDFRHGPLEAAVVCPEKVRIFRSERSLVVNSYKRRTVGDGFAVTI